MFILRIRQMGEIVLSFPMAGAMVAQSLIIRTSIIVELVVVVAAEVQMMWMFRTALISGVNSFRRQ